MPRIPDACPSARYPLNSVPLIGISRFLPRLVILAFCLVIFASQVLAQSATATLSGTVTDEAGAVISGANIAVINTAQGFQRSTTTNAEGAFVVTLLPPGNYSVKVEHAGFNAAELKDVILNVNDQKVIKVYLKVGNISQTVEVVDSSSLIDESPAVATIIDRQFVDNLPLNGRSFQSLITLSPGIVLTKTAVQDQGQFSANGQRADTNYFTVDGVGANISASASTVPSQSGAGALPGLSASGGTNNLVSVDALQEFKVQTSTYAPEFGRTPGAQVSIVTRSGTNEFRGSVFDYFRNDMFDANDWFGNRLGREKPALRQNDFGGVLGGPLYLPRFGEGGPGFYQGRNRAFFFFSYEGLRLRQPQVAISDVPSLAARQAAPSAVRPFLDLYPRPNGPNGANNLAQFSASFSNPSTLNATSIRIDTNVSDKLILFGRYNYSPSQNVLRGGITQTLNTLTHFDVKTHTLTLGSTYLLSSSVTNDLRFNYSRNLATSFFTLDGFGGAIVSADVFPSGRSSEDSFFNVNIIGAQLGAIFWGKQNNSLQRQFNIVDGLSLVRGNHQLKAGIDYRRLSPIFNSPAYLQQFIFSGVGSLVSPATGTVLSGRALFAVITAGISPQTAIFNNLSVYAQDSWKIARKLTLTYGVRWELNPPPYEANGKSPVTLTQVDNPATFALAPRGTPLWKTTYDNFAPRVGVSYQLSESPGRETILRGGFGLFYDLGNGQASNAFIAGYPFFNSKPLLLAVPIPLSPTDAAAPVPGPSPTTIDNIFAFDPELELPRVYQWNVSVEHSLGPSQSLTASYVAAVGRQLLRLEAIPNPNANLRGNYQITRNNATSDYHAMQLQFQRRLSRGLQALASYTWSHSIDIASSIQQPGTSTIISDPRTDRGPSSFDVRHAVNAAVTYNFPSPKAKITNAVFSRWSLDSIFTSRSATPVNVTYGANVAGLGVVSLRPDLVSGIPLYLDDPNAPGGKRFNNTQVAVPGNPLPQVGPFLRPTLARQGSLGRNALRGFPMWQWDLALRRQFKLAEERYLQFKAEFFNVLNHPNFADPSGSLSTLSTFGVSTSMLGRSLGVGGLTGGFNPLYQVGGPRSMQLSLRLEF